MTDAIHDIYYIRSSEKCCDVIDGYALRRAHIGNALEDEGLGYLFDAIEQELHSWKEDFYYKERIRMEAMLFLQNVMYQQYRPNNTWNAFYGRVLDLFHQHGELLFKSSISHRKNYLKKKPCMRIELSDGSVVPYMSYIQLGEDFGRYRTDVITRYYRHQDEADIGKNIDFATILELIL